MIRRAATGVLLGLGLLFSPASFALEEHFATLTAFVEVAPVFGLTLNNPHLAFQSVTPGKTQVLGEGHFFNEVRCRSNSGRSWHLKAQLISLKHLQQGYAMPPAQLRLRVVETTGSAEPTVSRTEFQSFSEQPMLVYSSSGDDNRGRDVALRFQYSLSTPEDAPAGVYVGQIVFTMAESL